MKSIGFNQQSITSKMIYIHSRFALFANLLWSKIGTNTVCVCQQTIEFRMGHALRPIHSLVFPTPFHSLLNECVPILWCSLIFTASKFTPFIFTLKLTENSSDSMLISLSLGAFASNRFLFLFPLKTKLHQEFDKHSNVMRTWNHDRTWLCVWEQKKTFGTRRAPRSCYFCAWLQLSTLVRSLVIVLCSITQQRITFSFCYFASVFLHVSKKG